MSAELGYRRVLLVQTDDLCDISHALRGSMLEVTKAVGVDAVVEALTTAHHDCVVIRDDVDRGARIRLRQRIRDARPDHPPILVAHTTAQGGLDILVARIMALIDDPAATADSYRAGLRSRRRRGKTRTALDAKTILIVDDDSDIRAALARTLTRNGARVMHAATVVAALQTIDTVAIDLVVSDYAIGPDNGLDLLAEIRRRAPTTGRLLISGHDLGDLGLPGDRDAADQILMKPWDVGELLDACDRLLDR